MGSFKDDPNSKVLVCTHLLNGAELKEVYHLDVPTFSWRFLCGRPEHCEEDIVETTLKEICALYPEIDELADMPLNCMCRKGNNSGKWYDFHF